MFEGDTYMNNWRLSKVSLLGQELVIIYLLQSVGFKLFNNLRSIICYLYIYVRRNERNCQFGDVGRFIFVSDEIVK